MSTSFYVPDDPTCDNPAHTATLHLGQQSGGWLFLHQALPDHSPPLTTWAAWRTFLAGKTVTDEYGRTLTAEEFIAEVAHWNAQMAARPGGARSHLDPSTQVFTDHYRDDEGAEFSTAGFG